MPEEKPKGEIIMMGKRERVVGWKGQLYVAIIKDRSGNEAEYKVVCDSTDEADLNDLPPTKVFKNKMEAFNYAMEMERSKKSWKYGVGKE